MKIPAKKLVIMTIVGVIFTITMERYGVYDRIGRLIWQR